jgi:hypothetical protein
MKERGQLNPGGLSTGLVNRELGIQFGGAFCAADQVDRTSGGFQRFVQIPARYPARIEAEQSDPSSTVAKIKER